jgi:aquaporin Z
MTKRAGAEFLGTFWLTFGGCGSAVLAAGWMTPGASPVHLGIGFAGVALAFGLTVLTGAYTFGHISGGHFNPAVTFGVWAGGRMKTADMVPYIIAQVAGAIVGAFVLYVIASGHDGFSLTGGFASNGFGDLSPTKYNMVACFITEALLTFFFLIIILGSTSAKAPAGFAPIAIGLGLTLIHLISIPVTNTSVNPARSTGPALVELLIGGNGAYAAQLWLFWIAPIAGAVLAGIVSQWLQSDDY